MKDSTSELEHEVVSITLDYLADEVTAIVRYHFAGRSKDQIVRLGTIPAWNDDDE